MKITMIGDRGCGKTTFMAGLYRVMTDPKFRSAPEVNLNIRLSNREQRARVDAIAHNLSRGEYPSATSFEQEYKFDFIVDGVKLLDFSWFDYRGGALMEGMKSDEAHQLFNDIDSSDGLLVFIDETTLDDHRKWNKNSRYWRTIQQAVRQHAVQASEKRPRSLGIVHTKTDAIVQSKSLYPIEENVNSLIDSLSNRQYLYGIEANSAITRKKSINTKTVFLRIMTPFITSALKKQSYKIEQTKKLNDLFDDIDYNYSNTWWLDDFLSGFLGEVSSREKVVDCVNLLKTFPLFKSKYRKSLINSFLVNWRKQGFFNNYGAIAKEKLEEIFEIWANYENEINTLFGNWNKNIQRYLKRNDGMDKGGYVLF